MHQLSKCKSLSTLRYHALPVLDVWMFRAILESYQNQTYTQYIFRILGFSSREVYRKANINQSSLAHLKEKWLIFRTCPQIQTYEILIAKSDSWK